jgi:hypothetical protein
MASTNRDQPREPEAWRPGWRWIISGLLAFHVTAVFMGPFAFSTRTGAGTSSEFARPLMRLFRPYVQAMFLDHGYAFFAPDPGPSHLVRYKVEFDDGRPAVEGTFPDLATERPRLLYHRHFMLAEQLHDSFAPPVFRSVPPPPPSKLNEEAQERWDQSVRQQAEQTQLAWQRDRAAYDARWAAFEQHLLHKHGGTSVSMARIEHRLPRPEWVETLGMRLDDSSLYSAPLTKDDSGIRDEPPPPRRPPSAATGTEEDIGRQNRAGGPP